jgi:hypothetical protein
MYTVTRHATTTTTMAMSAQTFRPLGLPKVEDVTSAADMRVGAAEVEDSVLIIDGSCCRDWRPYPHAGQN